ncbi:amidase [Diaphorobacter sp. LR2014-1]|nr:amidase [Diaphorobacter sp. LR2014-1]
MPAEPWRWSAVDIARKIADGALSSVEATQSILERIAAVNGRINAIVHLDTEAALDAARAADTAVAKGMPTGVLNGVPVTIKLNVDVRGEATTNGVSAFKDRIAPDDSSVVSNLRAAGAVFTGRTNTPPFNFRWFTENPLHGRTLNPWSDDIGPGGSSGGAGAALASGMCPLAHGTDIGGSIRYPAYVNGVAGLRPTPGRIPAYHPTTGLRHFGLQAISAQGPMARSVADLELGLLAMCAPDMNDPMWIDAHLDYADDTQFVRVGLVENIPDCPLAPAVRDALRFSADWLSNAGYMVEKVQLDGFTEGTELWQSLVVTEFRQHMMAMLKAASCERFERSVQGMIAVSPSVDLAAYLGAHARRDALRRQWNLLLNQYPLLLMPTSCLEPLPWDADLSGDDSMQRLMAAQSPLLTLAVLGLPSLSIPTGLAQGLPSGVQLVAGSFRERRLLVAGQVIERAAEMPNAFDRLM